MSNNGVFIQGELLSAFNNLCWLSQHRVCCLQKHTTSKSIRFILVRYVHCFRLSLMSSCSLESRVSRHSCSLLWPLPLFSEGWRWLQILYFFWTWHLLFWSSWNGGVRLKVGLNSLRVFFQPDWFCGSVILSCWCNCTKQWKCWQVGANTFPVSVL